MDDHKELIKRLRSASSSPFDLGPVAAAPQPEPNHNWCAGCSPDNCSGCGAAPVTNIEPQRDRTAQLEAALKVARDALGSAKYVIEMAQLHKPGLKLAQQEALSKINEALHD